MPTPIQVAGPVGSCIYNTGAFAFVRGTDQNLWVSWQADSNDTRWLKLGGPIGEGIAVLTSGPFMYAFAQNAAKGMTCFWFNGAIWSTLDVGAPAAGVTVVGPAGSTVYGNFLYVFVRGSDGNLWTCWWNGAVWTWLSLGKPSPSVNVAASAGIAVTPGGWNGNPVMYVFLQGSDNHLWTRWWNGAAWFWADFGVTLSAPIGAIYSGTFVYVFVKGTNGNLCCHWLNGTTWTWVDLGLPPGVTIADGLGAASYLGNPAAYFTGSDGRLWANFWGVGQWNWVDLGHPHFGSVAGLVGLSTYRQIVGALSDKGKALAVLGIAQGGAQIYSGLATGPFWGPVGITEGSNTISANFKALSNASGTPYDSQYTFVRGSDGHLWQYLNNGTEGRWSDLGTVDWT